MRTVTFRTGALVLLLGLLAWFGVGGLIVLDNVRREPEPPTPVRAAERATPSPVPTLPDLPTETPTVAPSVFPSETPALTLIPPTVEPTATPAEATPLPSETAPAVVGNAGAEGPTGTPNGCPPPEGWVAYQVQPGDTLFGFQLGANNTVDVAAIMAANCLENNLLSIGQVLYLPAGAADDAPKIDESDPGVSGPRPANCPCQLTIRPGWRLEQIAAAVDNLPVAFRGRDFLAVTAPGASAPDHWFLSSRPAGKSLEGFMFPGTYTLDNTTTAEQFRNMALDNFAANVPAQYANDIAGRGLTFWQAVVIASIIQRESYHLSEQTMISSVIYNRMAAGKGLGMTVTVQYAVGRSGNWWPRIGTFSVSTDSPYNTNLYRGLPPSPISNPGLDALTAAVYPAQTDYQYYNTKCGGGGNFYARTFEEFKQGLNCSGK